MEMIDRFLSQSSKSTTMSDDDNSLPPSSSSTTTQLYLTNRKQYQLLSMSSLYIAIKAHEPIAFASDMFASMSNGLYTISDIEEMECYILKTLQWNINCPTNVQFAYHVLSLIYKHLQSSVSVDDGEESSSVVDESTWCFILDETRFQIEYALRDYSLSNIERGSTVALASILNALDRVTNEDEKQCILHTLLSVMKEYNFDSLDQVYVVKDRLSSFVSGNDSSSSSSTESSEVQEAATTTPVSSPATSTASSPVTTKSVNSTTSTSPRTSMWSSSR